MSKECPVISQLRESLEMDLQVAIPHVVNTREPYVSITPLLPLECQSCRFKATAETQFTVGLRGGDIGGAFRQSAGQSCDQIQKNPANSKDITPTLANIVRTIMTSAK